MTRVVSTQKLRVKAKPKRIFEGYWLRRAMLRFSRLGYRVFRNNVGFDKKRKVKYGLRKGSADLIGWRSYVVKPEDVGKTFALFVAIEVKRDNNQPTEEQERFLMVVATAGGEAWVTTNDDDVQVGKDGE